jgi:hypothetical protein
VADIASCVWKLEVSHWPHIGGTVQECGVLISICPIIVLKMTQNFFTLTIGGWLLCQPQLCCMILQTHQVVLTLFCFGHHNTSFTSQTSIKKKPSTLGSTSHSPYISSLMFNDWGTKHRKALSVRINMHEYNAQQYAHDSINMLH